MPPAKSKAALVGEMRQRRQELYELFYAGSRTMTTAVRAYRSYDFAGARGLVERCLAGYELPPAASGDAARRW